VNPKTARRFLIRNNRKIMAKEGPPSFWKRIMLAQAVLGLYDIHKLFLTNVMRYELTLVKGGI